MYVDISIYISISLSLYIYIYISISLSLYIYIYIYVYIYIYIYIYTHIHITAAGPGAARHPRGHGAAARRRAQYSTYTMYAFTACIQLTDPKHSNASSLSSCSQFSCSCEDPGRLTVSFYNIKSQNFKSSVSNPKNKYVAYVSVLSQISNCQGLGRKNKFEILKTDRSTYLPLINSLIN